MKQLLISAFVLIALFGVLWCGITNFGKLTGVTITQDVGRDRYIDSTFYVKTEIWVYNWIGISKSYEYNDVASVKESNIETEKKRQMQLAYPVYLKVKKIYNNP